MLNHLILIFSLVIFCSCKKKEVFVDKKEVSPTSLRDPESFDAASEHRIYHFDSDEAQNFGPDIWFLKRANLNLTEQEKDKGNTTMIVAGVVGLIAAGAGAGILAKVHYSSKNLSPSNLKTSSPPRKSAAKVEPKRHAVSGETGVASRQNVDLDVASRKNIDPDVANRSAADPDVTNRPSADPARPIVNVTTTTTPAPFPQMVPAPMLASPAARTSTSFELRLNPQNNGRVTTTEDPKTINFAKNYDPPIEVVFDKNAHQISDIFPGTDAGQLKDGALFDATLRGKKVKVAVKVKDDTVTLNIERVFANAGEAVSAAKAAIGDQDFAAGIRNYEKALDFGSGLATAQRRELADLYLASQNFRSYAKQVEALKDAGESKAMLDWARFKAEGRSSMGVAQNLDDSADTVLRLLKSQDKDAPRFKGEMGKYIAQKQDLKAKLAIKAEANYKRNPNDFDDLLLANRFKPDEAKANMIEAEIKATKDIQKYKNMIIRAAEQGHLGSKYHVAQFRWKGIDPFTKNQELAIDELHELQIAPGKIKDPALMRRLDRIEIDFATNVAEEVRARLIKALATAPSDYRSDGSLFSPQLHPKDLSLAKHPKTTTLQNNPKFAITSQVTINSQTFYFSDILQVPGKPRDQLVMYTKNRSNQLVPRYFYKSMSDGGWRSSPEIGWGGHLSKGDFHYTQETKPLPKLIEHFEVLENKRHIKEIEADDDRLLRDEFSSWNLPREVKTFPWAVQHRSYSELKKVTDCSPGSCFSNQPPDGGSWGGYHANLTFPPGFIPDFKAQNPTPYKIKHTILGDTNIYVFKTTFQGRQIEWHMATTPPPKNQRWIERISYASAKPNSYGIANELFDSGTLTQKPVEYLSQATKLKPGEEMVSLRDPQFSQYVDITPLLQNMEPIKRFSEFLEPAGKSK